MADSVEVSVTHQVKIGREDAWIKVGVHTEVIDGETLDSAVDRADKVIQSKIFEVIDHTVEAVNSYEG